MPELPSGTVSFLFTDVEGSTGLWEDDPEAMRLALARHDGILRSTIERHGGYVFTTAGDSFAAAFEVTQDAASAALEAQSLLGAEDWASARPLRVRMAVHCGVAELRDGDYFGAALNRGSRLLAVGHGGQVLLSQSAASLLGDGLDAAVIDLGQHRLKDLTEREQVFQLSEEPDQFPPLRSLDVYPNNLPLQLTSFVGRDDQLDEVCGLILEHRLLTLTGVGGSGKTRLALQAAGSVIDSFSDGAWLVELAPVAEPELVPQAVVEALGAAVRGSSNALETLESFLGQRQLLMVLDNCEHVLEAVADLTESVLRFAEGVHIVATSREGLAVAGERLWRVPSLQFGAFEEARWAEAREWEAVRLFDERSSAVQPDFELNSETVASVVTICERLDGMPLAIELAAARTRVLPVDQIAERLSDRFRLLTGRSRTAVPRHQTLLATVEWSYELLSDREKLLFDRLAVFRGGFTMQAAETVCTGSGLDEFEVLDLLTQLVDKSLVTAHGGALGTDRFRMLETLRQYSLERLVGRGEADEIRGRHAAYFLSLAQEAEPLLETADMADWLDRLETEHDNLRAALGWMLDMDEVVHALKLTVALSVWFWFLHRHHEEAHTWHDRTLSASGDAPDDLLADAYAKASMQAARVRRTDDALQLADEAQRIGSIAGNHRAEIVAAWTRGDVAMRETYDDAAALEHFHEALRQAEAIQDDVWICRLAYFIALVLDALDQHEEALAFANRSLDVGRHAGWPMGIAEAANLVAHQSLDAGDFDRASELAAESLTIEKTLGDPWGITESYETLAVAERLQGHPERAQALAQEGLDTVGRTTDLLGSLPLIFELAASSFAVEHLNKAIEATVDALVAADTLSLKFSNGRALSRAATILTSHEQTERAINLFAAAEHLFEESIRPRPFERAEFEAYIADAREQIGPQHFNAAWKVGRSLDPGDATQNAIRWLGELKQSHS